MKERIKPLFIFCLPRSGSTLLQKLLMTHKKIFSVNEPWLLLPFIGALRQEGTTADYSHRLAYMALQDFMQSMGGEDAFYKILHDFILDLYEASACHNRSEAAYFLDKTPRYYLIIPQIARLFPAGKFIFLFRNPLAVFASVMQTWHDNRLNFDFHHIDLFEGHRCLSEGCRLLEKQSIKVNYEKLVKDTRAECERIAGFLDLDINDFALEKFKELELKGMMGDAVGTRNYAGISGESIEKWKTFCHTRFRKRVLKEYLRSLDEEYLHLTGTGRADLMSRVDGIKARRPGVRDFLDYSAMKGYRKIRRMCRCSKLRQVFPDRETAKTLYD